MRQIKFRAWCEEDKVMIYDLNSPHLIHGKLKDDLYKFMQFTGLQDKNGIDIYEGDLLKVNNDGEEYITQVRYESGALAIDVTNEDYSLLPVGWIDHNSYELEIIGNIYQNPELSENK